MENKIEEKAWRPLWTTDPKLRNLAMNGFAVLANKACRPPWHNVPFFRVCKLFSESTKIRHLCNTRKRSFSSMNGFAVLANKACRPPWHNVPFFRVCVNCSARSTSSAVEHLLCGKQNRGKGVATFVDYRPKLRNLAMNGFAVLANKCAEEDANVSKQLAVGSPVRMP